MRRGGIPRWLGYQLSKIGPLFFRWRGNPAVNAAFKVSNSVQQHDSTLAGQAELSPGPVLVLTQHHSGGSG